MGETRSVSTPEQEALFEEQRSSWQAEQQLDKPALRDTLQDALQDADTTNGEAEARGPETRSSGDKRVDGGALPTPGVVNTRLENTQSYVLVYALCPMLLNGAGCLHRSLVTRAHVPRRRQAAQHHLRSCTLLPAVRAAAGEARRRRRA
jgi:hypothetical protein